MAENWYKLIPTPSSRAERMRSTFRRETKSLRVRKPPTLRPLRMVFFKQFCRPLHIDGFTVLVMTRPMIARFFNIPLQTVFKWDELGVLPEPFYTEARGGSFSNMYLSTQIRCLAMVVRQLVQAGYVSIRWAVLPEHMVMLEQGYDRALDNFYKRFKGADKSAPKNGVIFYD